MSIKNLKDNTIIKAIEELFNNLTAKSHKPTINVTVNQATKLIKAFLKIQNCRWKCVEPINHRVNAVERAVQTYKHHVIGRLCSINSKWLLQLRDQLAEQAMITLNIICTSRINPTKSTYH